MLLLISLIYNCYFIIETVTQEDVTQEDLGGAKTHTSVSGKNQTFMCLHKIYEVAKELLKIWTPYLNFEQEYVTTGQNLLPWKLLEKNWGDRCL